jgi:hypothetical protein
MLILRLSFLAAALVSVAHAISIPKTSHSVMESLSKRQMVDNMTTLCYDGMTTDIWNTNELGGYLLVM